MASKLVEQLVPIRHAHNLFLLALQQQAHKKQHIAGPLLLIWQMLLKNVV